MKFVSIKKKLMSFTTWILMVALGSVVVTSIVDIMDLQNRLARIEKDIRANLISKGRLLLYVNTRPLRRMMEDNGFSDIRALVTAALKGDTDVVYGIAMTAKRLPWANIDTNGMNDDTRLLDDEMSLWAQQLTEPGIKEFQKGTDSIIEFAAPVMANDKRLGTIRYGLSTKAMHENISATKTESLRKSLIRPSLLLLIGLLFFIAGKQIARRRSKAITRPLDELTQAADAIAKGNYTIPIDISSNDEIGILADSFDIMRQTIREYTETLEQKVTERTRQLRSMQKELVDQAHKSGMAEIATAVLHNIGNILNSVMTSGEQIKETILMSHLADLKKANRLLRGNMDDIESFITNNPKGLKLLEYYLALEALFRDEHEILEHHSERLMMKIEAIRDVIFAQQSYASGGKFSEELQLADVVEDTLKLQEGAITRHNMHIEKWYEPTPDFLLPRAKLMQIMMNLFKNAKEAMITNDPEHKLMTVYIQRDEKHAYLKVKDTGCGIKKENLKKIFSHGFTTKVNGHGFGLHSCANLMTEMGGKIWAESEGEDQGATFVLQFEIKNNPTRENSHG